MVLGDVGTGKTKLCRKMIQLLKEKDGFLYHMVLDPKYETEEMFFASLIRNFEIDCGRPDPSLPDMKEAVETFLFRKGVEENRTVVLIIDEAQKLNEMLLECLRVLLNYETNRYKLLQLVLLGQVELHSRIMNIPNFLDRISFKYMLNPLDREETARMIEFRVMKAGYRARMDLFLEDAVDEIHRHTGGYLRQVTMLCHRALTNLIMKNRQVVDGLLIREIVEEEAKTGWTAETTPVLLQKSSF